MPISTHWYDAAHRVIVLEFDENWTWEEFTQAQDKQADLAATVSHDVVALIEMSRTHILPKDNLDKLPLEVYSPSTQFIICKPLLAQALSVSALV